MLACSVWLPWPVPSSVKYRNVVDDLRFYAV